MQKRKQGPKPRQGQRAKGKGQRAKGKGQRAKGKRQKAKGKRQKAKGKRQKAKGKRQKAKGKRQKAKGSEKLDNDRQCNLCGDKMVDKVEVENVNAETGKEFVFTIESAISDVTLSQDGCAEREDGLMMIDS